MARSTNTAVKTATETPKTATVKYNKRTDDPAVVKKMTSTIKDLPTVSSKIRALNSEGYTRSEIATFLGKRYQHVRNVLVTPLKGDTK